MLRRRLLANKESILELIPEPYDAVAEGYISGESGLSEYKVIADDNVKWTLAIPQITAPFVSFGPSGLIYYGTGTSTVPILVFPITSSFKEKSRICDLTLSSNGYETKNYTLTQYNRTSYNVQVNFHWYMEINEITIQAEVYASSNLEYRTATLEGSIMVYDDNGETEVPYSIIVNAKDGTTTENHLYSGNNITRTDFGKRVKVVSTTPNNYDVNYIDCIDNWIQTARR